MSKESSSTFMIFNRSVADYRANLALLIPALISALSSVPMLLLVADMPSKLQTITSTTNPNPAALIDIMSFMAELGVLATAALLISLVCTVGLAVMSARVITSGTCVLSDWTAGIKKYFLRILGITIILGILLVIVVAPATAALQGKVAGPISLLLISFPGALIGLVTYICYAPATVDNADVQSSISSGFSVVRKAATPFLVLLALFYGISLVQQLLLGGTGTFSPNSELVSITGNITVYTAVLRAVFSAIFLPFWFLATFELYREFSQVNRGTTIPS